MGEDLKRASSEPVSMQDIRNSASPKNNNIPRGKGVTLVVNGEQRKVSKNSKYLLDMLTLGDE